MKLRNLKNRRINRQSNTPLSLSNAMVCIDCEHIFHSYSPSKACPKCGAGTAVFLSRWLPARPTRDVKGVA